MRSVSRRRPPAVTIAHVTSAVIGLLGVVLGVVLTGAVAYWIEARRRGKAAEVSARLIGDDFAYAKAAVEGMLGAEMWVGDPVTEFIPIEQWRAERASLAAKATYQDWFEVATTARALALVAGFHNRRVASNTLSAPLTKEERDSLELAQRRLSVATPILHKYGGKAPTKEPR
jgi:ABC-type lipoprotein release transport system permease subunit